MRYDYDTKPLISSCSFINGSYVLLSGNLPVFATLELYVKKKHIFNVLQMGSLNKIENHWCKLIFILLFMIYFYTFLCTEFSTAISVAVN